MQRAKAVTLSDTQSMTWKWLTQNRIFNLLYQTVDNWIEDGALMLSAALAYYSIFSMAPLLIIAVSIAGLVFGEEAVRGQLESQLQNYVGDRMASSVQGLVESAALPEQGWLNAVTGFVILLVGASSVFAQLKDALNLIWGVKETKWKGIMNFVMTRLLSFGMVLVIGFLLLISLVLSTAVAALSKYVSYAFGVPLEVWSIFGVIISFLLVTVLFAIIFKVLPDVAVRWKDVWVAAMLTSVLFEVGKHGLSYYLGRESVASSYGAAGSLVLMLLWVYYASCLLLFGAEFSQVYSRTLSREASEEPEVTPPPKRARDMDAEPLKKHGDHRPLD